MDSVTGCDRATGGAYALPDVRRRAALLNRDFRRLARVIVHPTFRGIGLAVLLVRHALAHAPTPYVEALAVMGRIHPFFQTAGMTVYDRPADERVSDEGGGLATARARVRTAECGGVPAGCAATGRDADASRDPPA